ncbi:MAG: ATP-binding cassette domain-containing protein [Acidobacteria bacterium]|nr:ATP-binding cassette domain-containing protein [Acidobacteriota bacterium]
MGDVRRLLKYLRPYLGSFLLALILMAAGALLEGAIRALLIPILDNLSLAGGFPAQGLKPSNLLNFGRFLPSDIHRAMLWIAISLIGITLFKGLAEFASNYLMARIGQRAVFDLRCQLYRHLIGQSVAFFSRYKTNFLTSHLVNDVDKIELAVSRTMTDALRESFTLAVFLFAVFKLNWQLASFSLLLAPFVYGATVFFGRRLRRSGRSVQERSQEVLHVAQETLSGNRVVKAFGMEDFESRRFSSAAGSLMTSVLKTARWTALSPPIIELMGVVAAGGFILYAQRVIAARQMTTGEFSGFLFFLFSLYDPVRKLSRIQNALQQAFAASSRVFDLLDTRTGMTQRPGAVRMVHFENAIEFREVSFRYPDAARGALRDLNFKIGAGEVFAIVGVSGAGKTTLTNLIPRFYDVSAGSILMDSLDLRDLQLASLRAQVAIVTQDVMLFDDTVRHNIAYGRPEVTEVDLRSAARAAFALEFIEALPEGFDTVIGERGVRLSGGQRQRIAIARAILKNAPILILDEATSALDSESELYVQRALANLMTGRTTIVIAHRLSTVRRADRLIVLEDGQAVEMGPHAELLARGGVYHRLYQMQFATEEEAEYLIEGLRAESI